MATWLSDDGEKWTIRILLYPASRSSSCLSRLAQEAKAIINPEPYSNHGGSTSTHLIRASIVNGFASFVIADQVSRRNSSASWLPEDPAPRRCQRA